MIYSFVLDIVHHNQFFKSSEINKCSSKKYDFMHFGGHIGFLAAILDLRQNLRWHRRVFQIVWSEVHESTEKTLTGKKGSFDLAWT